MILKQFLMLMLLLLMSCSSEKRFNHGEWQKVASGLEFPEGPAWDKNGILYVSDCYGKWIARISQNGVDTLISADNQVMGQTNGLLFGHDQILYACDYGLGAILAIDPEAHSEIVAAGFNGKKFNRPNDITSAGDGILFFTDPKSYDPDTPDGRIFRFDTSTKEVQLAADNLAFPNGIAISPVDNRLYVCESARQQIVRFNLDATQGLSNREVFVKLPGGDPDGIEFDNRGNLFVAHFGGSKVYIASGDGRILKEIETPGKKPTNLEFSDNNFKKLYLTEVETRSVYQIIFK